MVLKLFDPIEGKMVEVSKGNKTVKRIENKDICEIGSCRVLIFDKRFVAKVNKLHRR